MLSDILDGYFPYDLKTKYPEGVPLRPVDQTDEMYIIPGTAGIHGKNGVLVGGSEQKTTANQTDQQIKLPGKGQFTVAQADEIHHKKKVELEPIREELEQKFRETAGYIDLSKLNSNEPIEIETEISENPALHPQNE